MNEKLFSTRARRDWERIVGHEFDDSSEEAFETADGVSR
jgi:hypothetical protein